MKKTEQLNTKISNLPLSEDLKTCLAFKEIETLKDLLQKTPFQWHQEFPGFNYHHQQEILNFLKLNNLMRFLQEGD